MQTIETVAVLGGSEAGTACAVLAALAGCAVRLHDPSPGALDRAFGAIRRSVEQGSARGTLTRTEQQRILDGILFASDLDEALVGADLVVDTGAEAPPALCARLAAALRATAAVAAAGGTSADELAARLPQPGRVLALGLAAPGGTAPRLEVRAARATSAHALERARAFAARVNRAVRPPGSP